MATQTHLARRAGVYYWRRALPRALAEKSGRRELRLSLRTQILDGARRRARRLSAIADVLFPIATDAMASETALPPDTIAALMADILRHELEAIDACRAMAPARTPEEAKWATADSLLARMGWLDDLETNDHEAVAFVVADGLERNGLDVNHDGPLFAQLCRRALRVMAKVETVNAQRELGIYREDDEDVDLTPAWRSAAGCQGTPASPSQASVSQASPCAAAAPAAPQERAPSGPAVAADEAPAKPEPYHRPISAVWEEYKTRKVKGDWKAGTGREAQRSADLFVAIIGDKPLDKITAEDTRQFREVLDDMPNLHGKSIYVDLKPRASIKRMKKYNAALATAVEADLRAGKIDKETAAQRIASDSHQVMTPKNVNKHLDYLGGLFKWAKDKEKWPVENNFSGQRYSKKTINKSGHKRLALKPEELRAIFETPLFTGSHPHFRHRPGPKPTKDAFYWAPLIMAHQGMRLEEVCQLHIEDVEELEGVWCFLVQEGEDRQLKTDSSARVIPLHSNLIRLGLIDHWRRLKARGEKRLFPELERDRAHRRYGTAITKKWTQYRRAAGIYEHRKDGHSLRHSFNTLLQNADIPTVRVKELMGHKREGETEGRYYHGATLMRLREAVEKLQFGMSFVETDGEWQIARPTPTEVAAAA